MLANFAKEGIDYPTTSLVSTRSTIKKDRETVKRFLMAYSEAVDRLFRDKELGHQNHRQMDAHCKIVKRWSRPMSTRPIYRKAAATTLTKPWKISWLNGQKPIPERKTHKAEEFIDPRFYNELEKSGFFKSLGR